MGKRIIELQEQTSVNVDSFVMTDNATAGTKKFNLKGLFDQVTEATTAANGAAATVQAAYEQAENSRDEFYAAREAARDASSNFTVVNGKICTTYYTGTI